MCSSDLGGRAPHAWLADGSALYDHFGKGFTLLRFGGDDDGQAFIEAAAEKDVPVSVYDVTEPGLRDLYEANLAIIRPDQYVGWRGDALPGDAGALVDQLRGV